MKYISIAGISLVLSFFSLVATGQAFSPSLVNITKPSPSVQAMQKFGDIPVSPYTGVPDISIPIYTIQFRDITLPVSLNYHASGIKVGEDASDVGLGWVLNAGGSVSRNVVGDDDFDGSSYLTSTLPDLDSGLGPQNKVQQGCILALINQKYPQLPTLYTDTLTGVLGGGYPVDMQPDQFYFNIPGKSGKFTLRHNGQVLLEKMEKVDISFASGGASWQIKDEKGNTYDFTTFELYQSTAGTPGSHKSAWYLTRITSPSGNQVNLNYTALPANFSVAVGTMYERSDAYQIPTIDGSGDVFTSASLGYNFGNNPATTYYRQVLSSIDFTNGVVKFNYSGSRTDLPGDVKLDSVSVYAKDAAGNVDQTPFKTFALYYSYFFGEQYCYIQGMPSLDLQHDPTTTRLRLDSVLNTGYYNGDIKKGNPYKFNYFQTDSLHHPSKRSLARDHWGYYNGKSNNKSLIPTAMPLNTSNFYQAVVGVPGTERDTDTTYARIYSLSSIVYPTGGSTELQMESNDFDPGLSEVNDHEAFNYLESATTVFSSAGYDVFNQRMNSDSVVDMSDEYYTAASGFVAGTPISITVTVRMNDPNATLAQLNNAGLMYFSFVDSFGHVFASHDLGNLGLCDANDQVGCLMNNDGVYSYTWTNQTLPPGKYTIRIYVSPAFKNTVADLLLDWQWLANEIGDPIPDASVGNAAYGFAGGLRARRIIDHDGISAANDHVKHYVYHYTTDKGNGLIEYSYGRRMARPQYFYFEWVGSSIFENDNSVGITYTTFCNHLFRSADSDNPLNGSAAGSAVGYDQVTVLDGENGENGKTVYVYYNQPDLLYDFNYVDELPHRPPANSSQPFPMNGSLLQSTDYANINGTFYKKKETINEYNNFPLLQNIQYGMESRSSMGDNTYSSISSCNNMLLFYPALSSQWNVLLTHEEKTYNSLADTVNYVDSRTDYSYDNPAHFLPTKSVTTDSKGDVLTTFTKYPLDYTGVATGDAFNNGILKLNAAHVIDAPVEMYQLRAPASGATPFVTKGVLTAFNSSLPKPGNVYTLQLQRPDLSFASTSVSNGTTTTDQNYVNYLSFDQYDPNGNLLQQRKVGDMKHAYVYDYNNALPVADVSNAVVSDIAYTSFESNGTGGWTWGTGSIDAASSITGTKSYDLNGSMTKSGLNSSTKYIVSFWAKGGVQFTVSGSQSNIVGKTRVVNGQSWIYYEYTVSGVSAVNVTGTGGIDELRLYPAAAQMKTCTFHPLAGMTSQCDEVNRVTYYEYDGLGRLMDMRDQDGNIIKTFEYHYKTGY